MLADPRSRTSDYQGGNRRHIDRPCAVAAGPTGVDEVAFDRQWLGSVEHHLHETGHLVDGLAFHPEGRDECCDLGVRSITVEDLAEYRKRKILTQVRPAKSRPRTPGQAPISSKTPINPTRGRRRERRGRRVRAVPGSCLRRSSFAWRRGTTVRSDAPHISRRPEELNSETRRPHCQLRCVVLGGGQVGHPLLCELALVGEPGRPVGEEASGLDVDRALAISHWIPWKSAMVLPKASRCLTYATAYMSAPSARPIPRAATIGRMEFRPSIARRKPPTSPMTFSSGTCTESRSELSCVHAADTHLVIGAPDSDTVPGAVDYERSHRVVSPARGVAGLRENRVPVRLAHT